MKLEKFALLLTVETLECITEISRRKLVTLPACYGEKRRFFKDTGPARNASCGEQTKAFSLGWEEFEEWLCERYQ
jgi:hypothetical protein